MRKLLALTFAQAAAASARPQAFGPFSWEREIQP
jgi:hypothetical protein